MYHSKVMLRLIDEAGLRVVRPLSRVGLSHSLVGASPEGDVNVFPTRCEYI